MEPMKPMKPMKAMEPMEKMQPAERWWSSDLGEATSTGSENDTRYAYFAAKKRLAVGRGGKVVVYKTGDTPIDGFSQSQGGSSSLRFSTGDGTIGVDDLEPA